MKIVILTFILSISSLQAAQKDFIDNDTFTTDTISGLDWLDVTTTVNMSKLEMLAQLGTGGTYDGWRYATRVEFMGMMDNFLGNTTSTAVGSVNKTGDETQWLVDAFGSTFDSYWKSAHGGQTYDAAKGYNEGDGLDYTAGFLADEVKTDHYYGLIWNQSNLNIFSYIDMFYLNNKYKSYQKGHYLIRDPQITQTPIPAAIWLMGSGLAGLLGFSRKKKGSTASA